MHYQVTIKDDDAFIPVTRFAHPAALGATAHLGEPVALPGGYDPRTGKPTPVAFFVLPASGLDPERNRAIRGLADNFAAAAQGVETPDSEPTDFDPLGALLELAREAFSLYSDDEFKTDIAPRIRLEVARDLVPAVLYGKSLECRLVPK